MSLQGMEEEEEDKDEDEEEASNRKNLFYSIERDSLSFSLSCTFANIFLVSMKKKMSTSWSSCWTLLCNKILQKECNSIYFPSIYYKTAAIVRKKEKRKLFQLKMFSKIDLYRFKKSLFLLFPIKLAGFLFSLSIDDYYSSSFPF